MKQSAPAADFARLGESLRILLIESGGLDDSAVTPEPTSSQVSLAVRVDVSAFSAISQVVVVVTAPDIEIPLAFNLTIIDGIASGSITVPTCPRAPERRSGLWLSRRGLSTVPVWVPDPVAMGNGSGIGK